MQHKDCLLSFDILEAFEIYRICFYLRIEQDQLRVSKCSMINMKCILIIS